MTPTTARSISLYSIDVAKRMKGRSSLMQGMRFLHQNVTNPQRACRKGTLNFQYRVLTIELDMVDEVSFPPVLVFGFECYKVLSSQIMMRLWCCKKQIEREKICTRLRNARMGILFPWRLNSACCCCEWNEIFLWSLVFHVTHNTN